MWRESRDDVMCNDSTTQKGNSHLSYCDATEAKREASEIASQSNVCREGIAAAARGCVAICDYYAELAECTLSES